MFPAISLLVIAIIYAGLSIVDLQKQAGLLKNQNQNMISKVSGMEDTLNQSIAKINQTISLNNDLQNNLTTAQKQISRLQSNSGVKTVSADPIVVTKTITETINHQVEKNQATVTIENVGSYKVDLQSGDNALTVLQRASSQNNFALKFDTYSFGVFITGIGGVNPTGNHYWAFYFNGAFSNVGASDQPVKNGDSIFWQLASF